MAVLISGIWKLTVADPYLQIRGSQWGGGFYGYRLKFWLFYGYRLIFFSVTVNKKVKINFFCFKKLNIN